jgi:saccharopine dehydrogenase-like NADP-dependent oxidoreductase
MKFGIIGHGKIGSCVEYFILQDDWIKELRIGDQAFTEPYSLPGPIAIKNIALNVFDRDQLTDFLQGLDGVLVAGPYFINRAVVDACNSLNVAYFDLSEDVDSRNYIASIATDFRTFVPQCGLAPGAINILASDLAKQFKQVRSIELRTGALPLYPSNEMKYYLSWSTDGLINEYINQCDAIYEGERIKTNALEGLEHVVIDGVQYEAFNTSGGAGTLCDTYADQVRTLNYKTLRYPGHQKYMKFLMDDLGLRQDRELLVKVFNRSVPQTTQDVIVIYINVVGYVNGKLVQKSKVHKIYGNETFSAIQLSTAAGAYGAIKLWVDRPELMKGFVKQEDIDADLWLQRTHKIYQK